MNNKHQLSCVISFIKKIVDMYIRKNQNIILEKAL